jgi:hypothetical protein
MIKASGLFIMGVFAMVISAQTFITPVGENWLNTANDLTVIPISGDSVHGSAKMVSVAGSQIQKIMIKDAAGEKHKYDAAEIKMLKMKLPKLAKMEQVAATASSSIENAVNTNYAALASMGYAVWENVKDPEGKHAYLLQVLNPWFCDYLKVYNEPKFVVQTGGFGNPWKSMPDELFVVKGGTTIEASKKKYKKELFAKLFSDCPDMLSQVPEKKRDWDDFPEHVKLYQDCMQKKAGTN